MQPLVIFAILFALLFVHDYVTDSRKKGAWLRALTLAAVWTGVALLSQMFGIVGWLVGGVLLVMALKGVMGYSTTGAVLFVIFVSIILSSVQVTGF